MTRKQRAAKLARRKEEQDRHRGRVRREEGRVNGHRQVIEVDAGPRPTPGFRRTNPYAHGEDLRQREQIVSFCASIGFSPTPEQIERMRELMREGKLTKPVVERMADPWERVRQATLQSGGPQATLVHTDEVELMTHEELEQDAWDQAAYEQRMGWPPPAQWAELEAAAKRKRRGAKGFIKVLTDAGYVLGKNEDPKDRKSWVRSS